MTKGELLNKLKDFDEDAQIEVSVVPELLLSDDSSLKSYQDNEKVWVEIWDTDEPTQTKDHCLLYCRKVVMR